MSCDGRIQTFLEALASALYVDADGNVHINTEIIQTDCEDITPYISCGNGSVPADVQLQSAFDEDECENPTLVLGLPGDIDLSIGELAVESIEAGTIETDTLDAGIVLTDEIKTDTDSPTDLTITTGAEKTLVLDTIVWDDLRITPGSFDRPGGTDPNIVLVYPNAGAIGTYMYEFAIDDVVSFVVQLPHSYSGGDIKVHLHWTPAGRGNEEIGKTVGWKLHYTWANIGGNFPDIQEIDLSDACDGTDWKHQMTEDVTITATDKHISSMLLCNLTRTDTGTDDTWATNSSGNLPLILEVDFHYPIDTFGSRTSSSK